MFFFCFFLKTPTVHLFTRSYFVVVDMMNFSVLALVTLYSNIKLFFFVQPGWTDYQLNVSFLKIWPAEIKLHVNLLYANSLYQKKNRNKEEATTSCYVTEIDYQ